MTAKIYSFIPLLPLLLHYYIPSPSPPPSSPHQ
ncbi:hypothetical protein BDCR2A_02050 [Borrelia duttonii CR2A]|uniref:Uncharacterized protein n=1 Tax=Borrelia duttonii CR2A TaxID=1432657 RepID=W6TEP3_9SPIR|nr:hypothetical protein BDCR2A_02050 [Borrelia duttonii CR2A]